MAPKLSFGVALTVLASLAIAPSAVATGIHDQHVAAQPARATRAASTPIAPPAICPNQTSLDTSVGVQEEAMRCMTDYARQHAGLLELADAEELNQSARDKTGDILRCDSFSHFACGREFTYWMKEAGYLSSPCWRAGENLAWGTGEEGTVRSIFRAWMRSPGHRQNILGDFSQIGISLEVGDLAGRRGTHVWTQHFGSHCDTPGA